MRKYSSDILLHKSTKNRVWNTKFSVLNQQIKAPCLFSDFLQNVQRPNFTISRNETVIVRRHISVYIEWDTENSCINVSTLKTSFGVKPNVLQFCSLCDFYVVNVIPPLCTLLMFNRFMHIAQVLVRLESCLIYRSFIWRTTFILLVSFL